MTYHLNSIEFRLPIFESSIDMQFKLNKYLIESRIQPKYNANKMIEKKMLNHSEHLRMAYVYALVKKERNQREYNHMNHHKTIWKRNFQ